ncbi:hypothetical protein ACFYVL_43855 [Streptomyces sp. NPDC004111]|uniref:hypothetical protein n=1 Tax=Streptomyces sp. NPDC004111 TaxID=3364690 RepID=UPI00369006DC
MASQHRNIAPTQCATCRVVMDARKDLASENPTVAPTTAAVCERTGLKKRAVQIHTVHLTAYGHLDGGAPTALPLDPDQATPLNRPATPLEWIASLGLTCETCRCILCECARLARGGWRCQISQKDLGLRLSLSEWTVRMHARTGHKNKKVGHSLRAQGHVQFRPAGDVTGINPDGTARVERRPDRWILNPAVAPAFDTVLVDGGTMYLDGIAERLFAVAEWFDPRHEQASWVVRLLADLIQGGWPEAVLLQKLSERPLRMPIKHPYRYVKARLPKVGTPYIVPKPELDDLKIYCARPGCPLRMHRPTPDGVCGQCRKEREQGLWGTPTAPAAIGSVYALAGPAASDPAF